MPHEILSLRKATEKKVAVAFPDETLMLPLEIVFQFQLRKNDILSDEVFEQLLTEARKFKVQESALRYISIRMHSSFELFQKLLKKKFEKPLINEVLKTLRENGLLNDKDFAERFSVDAFYHRRFGKNKIRLFLKGRGVAPAIIEEALRKIEDAGELVDSPLEEIARKKLKQLRGRKIEGTELSKKLTAFLLQRGYQFMEIRNVVRKILTSDELNDEQMEN